MSTSWMFRNEVELYFKILAGVPSLQVVGWFSRVLSFASDFKFGMDFLWVVDSKMGVQLRCAVSGLS